MWSSVVFAWSSRLRMAFGPKPASIRIWLELSLMRVELPEEPEPSTHSLSDIVSLVGFGVSVSMGVNVGISV